MNILGSIIKDIRKSRKMTQNELAEKTGFKQNTISNHENGKRALDEKDISVYAEAFGLSPQDLFTRYRDSSGAITFNNTSALQSIYERLSTERQAKVYNYADYQLREQEQSEVKEDIYDDYLYDSMTTVRLYGLVSAGTGTMVYDDPVEEIQVHKPVPIHDIALRVTGDSMAPLFQDGEIIYVNKTSDVLNGQIAVLIVNGQAYVKKIKKTTSSVSLVSLNKAYEDILLTESDDVVLIGVVAM